MGILEKNEMYTMLNKQNSDYAKLYSNSNSYPNQKNAKNLWNEYINNDIAINNAHKHKLTHEESHAIVYWVYRTLATKKEREILTIELFQQIKELSVIKHNIKNLNGIFYNESTIDLYFFSSITQITSFISKLNKQNNLLFFRGHSNPNYLLCPSITRTASLQQNESKLYHDLLINCPDDFINCNSHLEKLVKMQHYGLPTRLLDITKN